MHDQIKTYRLTNLSKNERAVYKIMSDRSLADEGITVEGLLTEYENRIPLDPLTVRDTRRRAAGNALRDLIRGGWLAQVGFNIIVTRSEDGFDLAGPAPTRTPEEVTTVQGLEMCLRGLAALPEDVVCSPELEELVSAIKTINRWARVFEAIRKAG